MKSSSSCHPIGCREVNEERSISHGRHRLKLRHNGYVVFDRTTEGEISA